MNYTENDLALGVRYSLNNIWDTNALLVALYDIDSKEYLLNLEASTRIGTSWRLSLEASLFLNIPGPTSVEDSWGAPKKQLFDSELIFFDDEDFVRLQLVRYF